MFIYYSEAGLQATNPPGTYTGYVTFVRGPPLPQPDSSGPWGYPYMRSLPHHQEEGEAV